MCAETIWQDSVYNTIQDTEECSKTLMWPRIGVDVDVRVDVHVTASRQQFAGHQKQDKNVPIP